MDWFSVCNDIPDVTMLRLKLKFDMKLSLYAPVSRGQILRLVTRE